MEFRILGPVEVWSAGQLVDAGHVKQRAVLAVLLLDLGKVVPIDLLIDRVWGDHPPASVRNNVYAYVARIRAVIAGAGDDGIVLTRRQGGYLLEADPEKVDLYGFRRRVRQAAEADDQLAARLLSEALALWRGSALADLHSPWLHSMRNALEQQRMEAVLDRGDIALRRGEHGALSGTLAEEAVASPANERLISQLMTALYRSGRQAEALRWFEQTRQHLAEELGADPAPELNTLHQQILRTDPALAGRTPAGRDGAPPPRELPADVRAFTGRSAEMAELDRLQIGALPELAAVVISAVSGTAGVGKTALAVHWAHRVAARFPDGQLYVNLRGYDPSQPMTAADALAGFLRALGVPGQDIPADTAERATRYRSVIAGKRILVLLDNASDVEQVRPLLPGAATCVAVVTSRDSLAGLVARDGARRVDLDLLPYAEAVDLLRALIGRRVDAEPAAAVELAARCARLPLALRVAAELAVARSAVSLADLTAELADGQRRLDLLGANGDPRTAVRAVFSWSYRHVDDATARAFRLLSLHPGTEVDLYAAAALTGSTLARTRQQLDKLASAHLIQVPRPGWYTMHDLLRDYAGELAIGHDGDEATGAALTGMFDHYLHSAAVAMATLFPAEWRRQPRAPAPSSPAPPLTEPAAARAWLDGERGNLVAVVAHAANQGWPSHATRLGMTLFSYLIMGHFSEAVAIHSQARDAARRTGDQTAEASALSSLGAAEARQGRYREAVDHFKQALDVSVGSGDRNQEARALASLGGAEGHLGRYERAAEHLSQAHVLYRQVGHPSGEATVLGNLGLANLRLGRHESADRNFNRALKLHREIGADDGEAIDLTNLGYLRLCQGCYEQAADFLRDALILFREIVDPAGEAHTLNSLGEVSLREGCYQQAADHYQQALAIFRQIGQRDGEAEALNGLGEALLATGEAERARDLHRSALSLASQFGDKYEQARSHERLARTYRAAGNSARVRHHWQEALARYTELAVPEAAQLAAELDRLGALPISRRVKDC